MALVRVYCGLASAYPPRRLAVGSSSLTATIVDDAGRTLDVCDIGDDSYGYAYLSTSLAERASGPYSVAIATDGDQQLVTRLLVAAGWTLAVVDEESTDEFADRFTDDFSGEAGPAPTRRRALGLARALQAGAISATLLPAPPELAEVKPVLAAHSALATGRHAAAVALREVLRELYPAALRAYPDPGDPVALAVMEALPEPGMLNAATNGRSRDAAAALEAVTAQLSQAGVADQNAVTEAITALRVAIAETPRRGGVSRSLTSTVAETVRQAVAAVRACDAASAALVSALAERAGAPTPVPAPASATGTPAATAGAPAGGAPASGAPTSAPASGGAPTDGRYSGGRSNLGAAMAGFSAAVNARNAAAAEPTADRWAAPPPSRQAAAHSEPGQRVPGQRTDPDQPRSFDRAEPGTDSLPGRGARRAAGRGEEVGQPATEHATGPNHQLPNRPVSPPPPPPPGITPIRQPAAGPPERAAGPGDRSTGPGARPVPERDPRGDRADWPTRPPADDWAGPSYAAGGSEPGAGWGAADRAGGYPGASEVPASYQPNGSAPYPGGNSPAEGWGDPADNGANQSWRSSDRPPSAPPSPPPSAEPPMLRLVEPTLPEELREDLGYASDPYPSYSSSPSTTPDYLNSAEPPPLRLVESESGSGIPRSVPPVSADDDDDLLIFAQTRSAWFEGDAGAPWTSAMDLGWQAAEQAAQPTVGERTGAGLPRRVPHANLVPGAPPRREERPLRVVRDPASIAAHTSGYFSGWRRGQEVGGFPVGNRPARRAAGAWEFHRDEDRLSS